MARSRGEVRDKEERVGVAAIATEVTCQIM